MIKMIKYMGEYVPEECCSIDRHSGADDFLGCESCELVGEDCEKCVANKVFQEYAKLTGQDKIKHCPKCGKQIYTTYGDGTAECDNCDYRFGVVEHGEIRKMNEKTIEIEEERIKLKKISNSEDFEQIDKIIKEQSIDKQAAYYEITAHSAIKGADYSKVKNIDDMAGVYAKYVIDLIMED